MPIIKKFKVQCSIGTVELSIKCNSKGIFSCQLPIEVANKIQISPVLTSSDISSLERDVHARIKEERDAIIQRRLVIVCNVGLSGIFTRDSRGIKLPVTKLKRLERFGYGVEESAIWFSPRILLEETYGGNKTYYNVEEESSLSHLHTAAFTEKRLGKWIATSKVHISSDKIIVPYTDDMCNVLDSIQKQLHNAAMFLVNLFGSENIPLAIERVGQIMRETLNEKNKCLTTNPLQSTLVCAYQGATWEQPSESLANTSRRSR